MGLFNIFSKKEHKEDLDKGLEKTKEGVFSKLARAVAGKSKVDEEVLDNLEEVLITSDVGVDTTVRIIERIEKRVAEDKYMNTAELNRILRTEITALLEAPARRTSPTRNATVCRTWSWWSASTGPAKRPRSASWLRS